MRMPNPRIAVPVALSGIAGGVVGYFVTAASCAPDSCRGAAIGMSLLVGLAVAGGVGVVVVLAVRSFAEWRQQSSAEPVVTVEEPQGPPTC